MELPAQVGYCFQWEYCGWVVVELPSKILKDDGACSYQLQIEELTRTHLFLAIDMSKTAFVDSSIIALLLSTEKQLREKGGKIAILSPQQQAADLFSVTSIDKIIKIVSDKSELIK